MGARGMPNLAELSRPLPMYSPKAWRYALAALTLRSLGRLSQGLRLAYDCGFDSGAIMNYIYENRPRGRTAIGRRLDRAFLDQVTCRAFRAVKGLVEEALTAYLDERQGRPTFVVDLAAGTGDYLLAALAARPQVAALLRDIDPEAVAQGAALARRWGLDGRVRYERGDALDGEGLLAVTPRPDLVVEIGLYGLIHDDEVLRRHLRQIRQGLTPDALLFNVQTYNPQIEAIARLMRSRDGGRCLWRLRPLEQVIAWAQEAGFRDFRVRQDPFGIYGVVLARN